MALPTITLTGNLTEDPALKFLDSGVALTKLRVACTERRKDQSGKWTDGKTTFIDVTCWRNLAEQAAQALSKGDQITVNGRLSMSTFTGKDGSDRISYEVQADNVAKSIATPFNKITVTDEEPF